MEKSGLVDHAAPAEVAAKSPRKLEWVDSVRGWAVLGVIGVHAVQGFPELWRPLYNLLHAGMYGVQLFFVVSAFTMLHSWNSRGQESRRELKFFIRRFFRIAPMFYVGIPLYTAFFYVTAKTLPTWSDVGLTLAFLHGFSYTAINKVVAGGWSIGVEFAFYVLIPWLGRVVRNVRDATIALGIGLTLVAVNFFGLRAVDAKPAEFTDYSFFYYWLPNQFFVFGLGFVLYWWWKRSGFEELSPKLGWACLLLGLGGLVAVGVVRPNNILSHVPFSILFLPFVVGMASRRPKLLVNRLVGAIGVNSFSIYIWQYALIGGLVRVWRKLDLNAPDLVAFGLIFGVATAMSYILAEVSRMWIEDPGQAWGRKVIARLQ
jgi:peptidoglycan/LPS O-acetylase OafA/YrhL